MFNNYYNKNLKGFARSHRNHSTRAEIRLWCELLRKKKMLGYQFLRQRPIGNYIADFFCKELMLVIETDRCTHFLPDVIEKDKRKTRDLEKLGYTLLRFRDDEVMDEIDKVKSKIEKWIRNHYPGQHNLHIIHSLSSSPEPPLQGGHRNSRIYFGIKSTLITIKNRIR